MASEVTRTIVQLSGVLLVIGALHLTASVSLPLAFAIFLMGLFWPLYRAVERVAPGWLAAVVVLLAFLVAIGLLGGALTYAGAQVAELAPTYERQWDQRFTEVRAWLNERGLPSPGVSFESIAGELKDAAGVVFEAVGGFVLIIAFLVLGLLEVHDFRDKLAAHTDDDRLAGVVERVATDFQRYIGVRTLVGLITGVLVGLGCWAIGLELAFVWGLSNFLLNYIPTLGSLVGVIPPVLFALGQGDWGMAAAAFGVVGGVQLLMGNYVDPLLQGRTLRLSALVVLLSVAFWGWVWGVPGAFLGVPITIVVALGCRQFERTRWIADLLADVEELDQ